MSRYVEIVKDGNNYVINPNASGGSGIDFTTPIWMYNTGDVRENFIAFDINNQPVPLTQASDVDNVYGFLVQGDYEATPKYVYRTDPNYTPLCVTGEYFDGYEWSDCLAALNLKYSRCLVEICSTAWCSCNIVEHLLVTTHICNTNRLGIVR
jgi:hypothetical protein